MDRFEISLDGGAAARLPADYLSLTIDTSLVLGGHWWGASRGTRQGLSLERVEPIDFGQPRLAAFARLLAPAMLRIGGTEADCVGYRVKKKAGGDRAGTVIGTEAANAHELVLKKKAWKRINTFAGEAGLGILFVVSAGPLDRDGSGAWRADDARRLIEYTARKGYPVRAWELGNEVNGYPFTQGLGNRVSARRYVEDFGVFSRLVRELHPGALAVGPASSVWPAVGEPNPIIPSLGRSLAMAPTDVLSWHYYPLQSSRGRLANRRASERALLAPRRLDSVRKPCRDIARAARGRQVWMTETGHALYGGERGLSDTHVSSLWWLDELGLLAREGVARVFRQSLIGADYGLLDQSSFDPRPDYYATFLWKRLMGPVAFAAPEIEGPDRRIRAYRHSSAGGRGRSCLLLVSLRGLPSRISLPIPIAECYLVEPRDGLRSSRLSLNGTSVGEDLLFGWGKKKTRKKYRVTQESGSLAIELPPYSYAFLMLEGKGA